MSKPRFGRRPDKSDPLGQRGVWDFRGGPRQIIRVEKPGGERVEDEIIDLLNKHDERSS